MSGFKIITGPTVEPLTVAEVKSRLSIKDEIDNEDIESARQTVMDAARKKMLSGDLLNREALRRAAEKLLDSGELDEAGDA